MFDNPTSYYTARNDARRTTLHPRDYHRKSCRQTQVCEAVVMRGIGRAARNWECIERKFSEASHTLVPEY